MQLVPHLTADPRVARLIMKAFLQSFFHLLLIQEGKLSAGGESMCHKYRLTA